MPKTLRLIALVLLTATAATAQPARPLVLGVSVDGTRTVVGAGDVNGAAPDARTIYEIGSVSKVLTALTLADAVARGEATLDTPVADLLADSVGAHSDGPIRLVDLATHTSGLPRIDMGMLAAPGFDDADPYAAYGADRLAAFLATVRPATAPGETVAYSNLGAGLLGYALARRAGTPYADLVRSRVLAPLGLDETTLDVAAEDAARFAPAHDSSGAVVTHWTWTEPSVGAGGWRSTAADMLTLAEAALAPETTSLADALALSLEPHATVAGPQRVGLGWFLIPLGAGGPVMALHDGGTGGSRSLVVAVPEASVAVVALTNSQISADTLAIAVVTALLAARAEG